MKTKRIIFYGVLGILALGLLWLLSPNQRVYMPVERASAADYNPQSFWFFPWGEQRHHIGVDIFAPEGRNIHPACAGLVISAGETNHRGGNVVNILGSGGRIYYYAHLSKVLTHTGAFVTRDDVIGLVGRSGNANRPGCPPHLHFSIFSLMPQFHDINESEASRNAYDHWKLYWLADPIKELQKTD